MPSETTKYYFASQAFELELQWEGRTTHLLSTDWDPATTPAHKKIARIIETIGHSVHLGFLKAGDSAKEEKIVCKLAHGHGNVKSLEREAEFYRNDLKDLQGKVVPQYFGFYKQDLGETIACLLLEYIDDDDKDITNGPLWYRRVMLAMAEVHKAGIIHGGLLDFKKEHIIRMGKSPRIVDFSRATRHKCEGTLPANEHGVVPDDVISCEELRGLEETYGVLSTGRPWRLAQHWRDSMVG
ncbi:hypothetical protein GALMADRAFT_62327 [Galerina marginata CBS 339.88]|uniref:Protein kinase domain-containing protein n=1 Tax=Galerina marginata (strain CBS 339.88) TaxID=685588 RepID=A0A067TCN8_GALM3|nr:hypothetical protein GALMADRAFT_62327 [Galerina marginata CBS 339.88]